ncbi:nicotinate phosphoribosyltransferase [Sedimenticola hydrogenitrophicus]|uniref:nicotinate phosphoribosyltransferase n=1 Tax=Sedimenticola hydrogenitrophicus TaxID=2967975 RepID=UPI0021A3A3ED|nr:nicotinate phosphoribosyltransferase [Sedimenticola hydrogenitrophicus]
MAMPGQGLALFTDLYELTMLQAYLEEGLTEPAVFSLSVRRLPARRNYLLACGIDSVTGYLQQLRFRDDDLAYLASLQLFSDRFLSWLGAFRFSGEMQAVPEGTPVFANEPILEVSAPLPEAQLIETLVLNQVHLQTVLASKAARVVAAAQGRPVIDFGARRMHGLDAALKAARAFYIGGVTATSNVMAGKLYGIPVAGTMAHSYVQAHEDEAAAFRAFARLYPQTILLVDTYDTLAGVGKVIALAQTFGKDFQVRGVRLDSGDLAQLAGAARQLLDSAGLQRVEIFASGGLDEDAIAGLLASGAPIDGFGVGTHMGVSSDAPDLDIAYKLCEYAGEGRLKLSSGKPVLPGRKQVFRVLEGERAVRDIIARSDEPCPGSALLEPVMCNGTRVSTARPLTRIRDYARAQIERLPAAVRVNTSATPPYPVTVSAELSRFQRHVRDKVAHL